MLRYRLTDTRDPEERLEDAALWKALCDAFGPGISIYTEPGPVKDDTQPSTAAADYLESTSMACRRLTDTSAIYPGEILLGRGNRGGKWPTPELAEPFLAYWEDPAFLAASGRLFELHDLRGALARVKQMHAEGQGAFLKSTRPKFWLQSIEVGEDPEDAIGAMAYSLMDDGPSIIVQALVEMECEMRFAVMNRTIVSSSPVAYHLTPLDTPWIKDLVARSPTSTSLEHDPETVQTLTDFAAEMASSLECPDCILDVCLSNGRPIAIELNPLKIGSFGLYGMDVRAIAEGVRDILVPRYLETARLPTSTLPAMEDEAWGLD